jgi:membrane associated rhomboid family serine protease
VTDPALSSDDFCYRHPGRVSYVLCQRCTKTVCGDCQIPAAVGVHCPECHVPQGAGVLGGQGRSRTTGVLSRFRGGNVATMSLLTTILLVYIGQWLSGGLVTTLLLYWPPWTLGEPWRMLTALFVHSERSLFHILFNGYSLWVLGMVLERLLGARRFLALFFTAGLGGSLAVLLLAPTQAVIGASGAIFGLFGTLLVIQRNFGGTNPQLLIVLILNLILGFVVPGISWQAHIGGLVVGILLGWMLVKDRESGKPQGIVRLFGPVIAGIVVVALVRLLLF